MSETSFLRKNAGKWIPGILISTGAILYMAFALDWSGFGEALMSLQFLPLLVLLLLAVISVILRGVAWHFLLNREASITDAFYIENVGYLLNNFLPLRMGEIGRGILMGQRTGKGFFETLSTIVIERFFDICFAAMTLFIATLFFVSDEFSITTILVPIIIVGLGLIVLFLAAKMQIKIEHWLQNLEKKIPLLKKISPMIHSLLNGLQVLSEPKRFIPALSAMLLMWSTYWFSYYYVIRQFVPEAVFWWGLLVDGIVALGIAIPSAPGSLGVWEASFVGALALVNVPQSLALTAAIVLHLVNYLVTAFFGVIGLIRYGRSFSDLFSEIQLRKNQSGD